MPPQAHPLSCSSLDSPRRGIDGRPSIRGRCREEPARSHPHCQGPAHWLCLSPSSSLGWGCLVWLSVSHGNAPPFVASLLCCPHFVKSPFIKPFSSVSCRNLDRYGCFSMDRVPAANFPVHDLWGNMWRVWHQRFKLLFIKGLFDHQGHLGPQRLKALPYIRCFYLLTYLFIQKYLLRTYYELDMVPGTGDAAENGLD